MKVSSKEFVGRAGALVLAAAVTVALCPTAALADDPVPGQDTAPDVTTAPATTTKPAAEKAAKPATKNLKQRGVKFNLKKNKWVKFKSPIIGGYLTYKGRVTKLKTTKAKKKGYKKSTFKVEVKLVKGPTEAQGRKYAKHAYRTGGDDGAVDGYGYWVVDYATGENLEYKKNSQKVTCKGDWGTKLKLTKKYYYKSAWGRFIKADNAKVTITYPESYQNLTVGIGASLKRYWEKNAHDRGFSNGKKAIWYKTSGFKRDIKNYRFMRIK